MRHCATYVYEYLIGIIHIDSGLNWIVFSYIVGGELECGSVYCVVSAIATPDEMLILHETHWQNCYNHS